MCGIAAIFSHGQAVPPGVVERMVSHSRHRGPDAHGFAHLPGCHLGHARLSVIDVAGGAQPMSDSGKRYWITFNGEIYNFQELRRVLEDIGATFRTRSDTEVLLQAYRHFGQELPARLNGQFAFAIWDSAERTAFLARDRFGEKPLYWGRSGKGDLLVASEIKALLASELLRPQLDRQAVDSYLTLLYVPPHRTIYENVHVLPPGHAMEWRDGQVRQWVYWRPKYSTRPDVDATETVEEVARLVDRAVERQMVADVPVGAFLSGGLDSSTIVALMADHTERVQTFAVGFGELIDETPFARAVSEQYRTDHHELQMDIPVGEMLERMAEVYDEPFADSSNIPTYLLSEFARRHVKVVLSGDGGDEVFGGYEWYRWLGASLGESAAPAGLSLILRSVVWRGLARAVPSLRARATAAWLAARAEKVRQRYADPWERHLALSTGIDTDSKPFFGPDKRQAVAADLRRTYCAVPALDGMDGAVDFDARCYLPGDILVKVDRAAMAHGLEVRAPFLDLDLVEFVWSLPWRMRFSDGESKRLLRDACGHLWPQQLHQRGKQGFGAPVSSWVRRPDVQSLLGRVTAANAPLAGLFPGARQLCARLKPQPLWSLLCLGLWLERRPGAVDRLAA